MTIHVVAPMKPPGQKSDLEAAAFEKVALRFELLALHKRDGFSIRWCPSTGLDHCGKGHRLPISGRLWRRRECSCGVGVRGGTRLTNLADCLSVATSVQMYSDLCREEPGLRTRSPFNSFLSNFRARRNLGAPIIRGNLRNELS